MAASNEYVNESQNGTRSEEEESWFAEGSRESRVMTRTSAPPPPPPIGDDEADSWFR